MLLVNKSMKFHYFFKTLFLSSLIILASCTYTTKLEDRIFPNSEYKYYIVKGDAAMNDSEWAKAVLLYQKAEEINPEDLAVKLKLAKAYQYDGKLAQAYNIYQIIIDSTLPLNDDNKKIVKAAKENQAKFNYKIEPPLTKSEYVETPKPIQPEELIKALEPINDQVALTAADEEMPALQAKSLDTTKIDETPVASAPTHTLDIRSNILDKVDNFSEKTNQAILEELNAWVDAWTHKQLKLYFAHYVEDFSGEMTNSKAWHHSRKLKILHSQRININLSDIKINNLKDSVEVAFMQNYQSGAYHDIGRKTLKMEKVNGHWLIMKETFK